MAVTKIKNSFPRQHQGVTSGSLSATPTSRTPHVVPARSTGRLSLLMLLTSLLFTSLTHATDTVTYYHLDALGSPIAASDEQGNVIWRKDYQPYGEATQTPPQTNPDTRGYTGHSYDANSGLLYMGARWYSPVMGRFMGVDPAPFTENDLLSFNRYNYANNNPYRYTDPDGRAPLDEEWRRAAKGMKVDAGFGPGMGPQGGKFMFRGAAAARQEADLLTAERMERALALRSGSRSEALNKAKDVNDIPRSAQPDKVVKPNTNEGRELKLDERNERLYEYTNSRGEKIHIREDKPAYYPDGGSQERHFNAGPANSKLTQHYYYP